MDLLNLIIFIILVGVVLGLINVYVPMAGAIKSLLNILVFIVLLIYILQFFGVIKMILPFPTVFHVAKGT